MTKYQTIADDIRQRIYKKEFQETKKIPSEDELIEQYQVSRNTIRNAIKHLSDTGFVYPIQGSGYYIHEIDEVSTFLGGTKGVSFDHPGKTLTSEVLKLEIIDADETLAKNMQCKVGTPIYHIIRLRFIDNAPYSLEDSYYNKDIIPYLGTEICEKSIFSYIQNDLKLNFGLTDKYLSVEKLDKEKSQLLNLEENDPAFIIEDKVHLSNGQRFNVSKSYYNYKTTKFYTMVK